MVILVKVGSTSSDRGLAGNRILESIDDDQSVAAGLSDLHIRQSQSGVGFAGKSHLIASPLIGDRLNATSDGHAEGHVRPHAHRLTLGS